MCGRFAAFRDAEDLLDHFGLDVVTEAAASRAPSWNVAPTADVPIVLERPPQPGAETPRTTRELQLARWGLVPPWAGGLTVGARLVNARIETAATKRSFAPSLARRRCLVVADGYYEWRAEPGGSSGSTARKTPFYIHAPQGSPLALAGLYAWWRDPSRADDDPARWVLTTTILTREARPALREIHDREPVVLASEAHDSWLDPALVDVDGALHVATTGSTPLAWHEVSRDVGSVRNDTPALVKPV